MKNQQFGATQKKKTTDSISEGKKVTKSSNSINSSSGNDSQMDMTITDSTDTTVQDLTDSTKDTMEKSQTVQSVDSVIADYSTSITTYWGNYATIENNSFLADNGDAKMIVNFGENTATLNLGNLQNPEPDVEYEFNNVNTSFVDNGIQVNGDGIANMTFYGPAGEIIKGDFKYIESSGNSATGNYSVETTDSIH
jgi:hypothetical protein